MADVFFNKFSELISSKEISRETKSKPEIEKKSYNKVNNKIIIYISTLVLLGIAIYLII